MSNYGNESIKKRTDREAVRQNPATYAGSTDINGAFTTVREIISNAIDEFKSGNGDVINVRVDEMTRYTSTIEVEVFLWIGTKVKKNLTMN